MKIHRKLLWCAALVLLAGCPGSPPEPGPGPGPGPTEPALRLTTVTVTCSPTSVVNFSHAHCTASATDQNGAPFTVPGYTWTSSDERVARVDAAGVVSTTSAGSVTLTASATADGVTKQGQASLTVSEKAPTVHSTPITADETWRASDNPHLVRGQVAVNAAGESATLTLEADVVVLFDADAQLVVEKGALKAPGTQAQPIHMMANQSAPTQGFWRGLKFAASAGDSLLEHVTLADCGRVDSQGLGMCLDVLNTTLVARDVTLRNSGARGLAFGFAGELAAGSARVSVFGSKGYAVTLNADHVGALPTGGTFTGNGVNAIAVFNDVTRSQTWPNLGIPYDILGPYSSVVSSPSTPTTLTLSAGTVLRFGQGASFSVGSSLFSPDSPLPADLIVNGTEEAPVRFTSFARNPQPGDWGGVNLGNITANTRISHAIIEYAGNSSGFGGGNLNLSQSAFCADCPTLDHVLLQKGSSYGLTLQSGQLAAGSTQVTIRDNGGYAISASADSVGGLPSGGILTISGNSPDAVRVAGVVRHSQIWPNLGIPYDISGELSVSGDYGSTPSTAPTLTLSAGTVLRFGPQATLEVGRDLYFPGDLIVNGTEAAPVRFTSSASNPQPGDWTGVKLGSGITSATRLSHAIIEYGGGTPSGNIGNLNLLGNNRAARPTLDHVVLRKSSGYGLMNYGTKLAEGSSGVMITENRSYAILTQADSAGGLPAGMTVSGNSPDAVLVFDEYVTATQTWLGLGIPYILSGSLQVRGGFSSQKTTLTLAAGAELRFSQNNSLIVDSAGALVVAGTAQAPVRLVPNASTPFRGFWGGISLLGTGNRIDYAFISHGGATESTLRSNLNVYYEDGGFVTHSTFSNSSTCGIMVYAGFSGSGRVTTDFTLPEYGNTFLDNTSAPQCTN